jgi:hypothetical protein
MQKTGSRFILLCVFSLITSAGICQAPHPQAPTTLDAAARKAAVDSLCKALKDNYVFPDIAEKTSAYLQKQLTSGVYDKDSSVMDFAMDLTRDVRLQAHDLHLRVSPHPPRPVAAPGSGNDAMKQMFLRDATRQNFGFAKVEHLDGNVGYLDLRGFLPPELAGDTAVAAMSFLANSDALIVDLRKNGGGDPRLIQLLTTYLFDYGDDNTLLNTLYWRKGERTDQYWTLSYVPGKRLGSKIPVYVLTSSRTFSGAEEFSNNLKELKRATIIGETTGGGANPGDGFDLTETLTAFIPTGRAINPISKKNWEGTGVAPDVKVPSDDAFKVAYKKALDDISAKAEGPWKGELQFLRAGLDLTPPTAPLSTDAMQRMSGSYGPARVFIDNGHLKLQMRQGPATELVQLSNDTFTRSDVSDVRFRFLADGNGNFTKLIRTTAEEQTELLRQ